MAHKKDIPELCEELRNLLDEFYENKFIPLEKECARYRDLAQKILNKKNHLEQVNKNLMVENSNLKQKVDYYRSLYLKERNGSHGQNKTDEKVA